MAYTRVTEEERKLIYRWRQDNTSRREIAQRLGRAASSIGRELVRNPATAGLPSETGAGEGAGPSPAPRSPAIHGRGAGRCQGTAQRGLDAGDDWRTSPAGWATVSVQGNDLQVHLRRRQDRRGFVEEPSPCQA